MFLLIKFGPRQRKAGSILNLEEESLKVGTKARNVQLNAHYVSITFYIVYQYIYIYLFYLSFKDGMLDVHDWKNCISVQVP